MSEGKAKRKNLQVEQDNIALPPDNNGWPTPLTDSGPAIKHTYTVGKSGTTESRNVAKVKTDDIPGSI